MCWAQGEKNSAPHWARGVCDLERRSLRLLSRGPRAPDDTLPYSQPPAAELPTARPAHPVCVRGQTASWPCRDITCVIQCVWVGPGPNSQRVEQLPERTRVTPQLWAASLTSNPLYLISEEYSRNLSKERVADIEVAGECPLTGGSYTRGHVSKL